MTNAPFTPAVDIPDLLWRLLEGAEKDPESLRKLLYNEPQETIIAAFRAYRDAQVELADRLVVTNRAGDSTEDTLDDLADAVVAMGKLVYCDLYEGRMDLPRRQEWEGLPTLIHVFGDVYDERFDLEIDDVLDED